MLDTMIQAAAHFLEHQLGMPSQTADDAEAVRTVIAYIDVEQAAATRRRVYVACNDAMIARISDVLLGETSCNAATRDDLALETANLVVGSAKVLAEEKGEEPFRIGTPHFLEYAPFQAACDARAALASGEAVMIIGIKDA